MAMPKLNPKDFTNHDPDDPAFKLAKKMAAFYRNLLKSENIRGRPFNADVPIELQGVFTHFLKAARIVIEEDGNHEDYLKAQFEGLKWTKHFPMPSQLATANARLRYMKYQMEKGERIDKQVREEDYLFDEFELQESKLRKLTKSTGLDAAMVLRMFGRQFTPAFLRSKGVKL